MRAIWILILLGSVACGSPEAMRPPAEEAEVCVEDSAQGGENEPAPEPEPAPDDEGADGPTVVLDGTPEVGEALRGRLNQYLNTRRANLVGLAPDGSSVSVLTRFAETSQLHRVQTALGSRQQLTFTSEPVRGAEPIPGDERSHLFIADVGGAEDYQIFKLDGASGRVSLLTDGVSRHNGWVFSHDGSQVAFNNNARNGTDVDVRVATGLSLIEAAPVTTAGGHWYPIDFSHDGGRLLVGHYVSINESSVHVVDLASGEMTRLTPETPAASYRDALFSRDGERVYITTDREGEHVELYEANPADPSATWRPLTRDIAWNVEALALSSDGRTLAISTNEEGFSVLRLLDTRSRRMRQPAGFPAGLIRDLRFAREADVLGMTLLGPTQTGDAYTYDLRRRRLVRWTQSEIGGLDPDGFIEPELIRYESFDGRQIPAFLYSPPGEGPHPVMVYIHGGPESQARPWFSPLTQYLARESGIAVVVPNVRGSDGYGKSYLLLDNGARREDSVRDIGSLLDWLEAREDIDGDRMAVYGGSYGGYMVLASLVHFGDRLRAGVDVVGISNFVTFLENTRAYRRDLRRAEYGDERDPEMRAHLTQISPVTRAAEIRSALFVAHGANDPRVPASEAEQVVQAVRGAGQDVWYMLARNEGHGFRKKENRDLFLQLTVTFLEEHLRQHSDAD